MTMIILTTNKMQTETLQLTAGATSSTVVGNKKIDQCAILHYSIKRNALYMTGKIQVTDLMSTVDVTNNYTGDDCGITLSGSYSSDDIVLSVALDSSAGDCEMKYTLEKIKI